MTSNGAGRYNEAHHPFSFPLRCLCVDLNKSAMPNRDPTKPVSLILGLLFITAAAIGAVLYGVLGAILGAGLVLLALGVSFARWSRWAVAPEKKIDLATARKQLQKLQHSRQSVRRRAANFLRAVGPDCAPIVPQLVELLGHPDFMVRSHVCQALGAIGPGARGAVPTLIEMLREGPFPAAFALGRIGPDAGLAVPALVEHLRAGTGNCESIAAIALWKIERKAELAVPALLDVLKDESAPIRRAAVHALSLIGPPAKAALPALLLALKDEDRWVRKGAADALWEIDPSVATGAANL